MTCPTQCPYCGKKEFLLTKVDYPATIKHNNKLHVFIVNDFRIFRCQRCRGKIFTEDVDRQIMDVFEKLKDKL